VRLAPLAQRVTREFGAPAHGNLLEGVRRLADYQDVEYAAEYLDRIMPVRDADARHGDGRHRLLAETARYLALWMSYEDTIRVADLKTRRSRFERVKRETRLREGQVLAINEYLHPRVDEVADTLPARLGAWLLRSRWARALGERFVARGHVVQTSSIRGYLLLYLIASLRPWRRRSLRYQRETARMRDWLDSVVAAASHDYDLALAIAECQRVVKGYSDTHARGTKSFETLMRAAAQLRGQPDAAAQLRRLRDAALADDTGAKLDVELGRLRELAEQAPARSSELSPTAA
jgi:indolepyruvate ferredoxin oxidoreductase beta subunit